MEFALPEGTNPKVWTTFGLIQVYTAPVSQIALNRTNLVKSTFFAGGPIAIGVSNS